MPHETALIATIAAGLGLAFLFGLAATRLRLPPILGYLLAGVVAGPYTPGFVADAALAGQLAEIGIMLLMFGVGLHFSIADLLAVKKIAVPGAVAGILVGTSTGAAVSHLWGWPWGTGIVFGLSLSVASTVVLLRTLEDHGILRSNDGRIAVGWLIVEDLVTVVALVMLPALAGLLGAGPDPATPLHGLAADDGVARTLAVTIAKVAGFVALMLVVGKRVVPWVLAHVVHIGSRELFTLAVLATAFGIAVGAAALFGVSFALGAFFAGIIVSESDFSHEAATNALPLQDAFAVLFFVSVGMLFDPAILIEEPLEVLAVILIILVGKAVTASAIVLAFRYPLHTALTIAASLVQIGEFSFILATLGITLGLLPTDAQSLIVAGALITITINPLIFGSVGPVERWLHRRGVGGRSFADVLERPVGDLSDLPAAVESRLRDHAVLIGHGRVGGPVADELARHDVPYVIVEQSRERVEALRARGLPVIYGDATRPEVLHDAHLESARIVVVATPDAFQARAILEIVRRVNRDAYVFVRTHSDEERTFLESHGAQVALVGERELAVSLTRHALRTFDVEHDMAAVAARTVSSR